MTGFINVIRNTLTELVGPDHSTPAVLPAGLPDQVLPAARAGVALLTDYQSQAYAQLYCDRLRRFIGRRGVDDALFAEIARLLAERMAYLDAIRIAQLKLQEAPGQGRHAIDVRRFRCDELLGALPVIAGGPLLRMVEIVRCAHRTVPIRFSNASWWGIQRLKLESSLRHSRRLSARYAVERVWVERWLHMIDRALTRQPAAVGAVVQMATMIEGYGTGYRTGMAAWHQIIDGLAKPVFDGPLVLPDLAAAIARARHVPRDPKGEELRKVIAEIRAGACNPGSTMA
ncbi:hypothetical protein FNL55_22870 [Tardiphaga sp. vice352]|uniref:DUF6537 domain-containing protein n=1 Tax=unclassified Tardiphaga TaxID=2631404 RepID=UPI0011659CB6|nr:MULTISPECIES: DUF6537 domain-containing protein [unclassified Tardiphaga]QDM18556.1 hypothetical protein FNL53_23395 [Tardiphaga sp. vice278]QDM23553.1 hypothetical protein FIU28_22180 [Tardiphaga sp. vice154]QDM28777.1 hypothetical protein FNL56_23620 [Tardiphaga sp. vice304]QDM33877.1 hypothetical protein FNL55_22870 [Tardiphaga sp. vice352]